MLDQLVGACVGLLGLAGAGLLLVDHGSLAVVAASSGDAQQLKAFEVEYDDGPCVDCFRTGAAVISGDLRADRARWPFFAPASLAAGFLSVAAVPLRLRSETIGSLGLFPRGNSMIGAGDRRLAQAFADVATIGILQRRSTEARTTLTAQLQHAVKFRVLAAGVATQRVECRVRAHLVPLGEDTLGLFNCPLAVNDIANAIISGDFDPG